MKITSLFFILAFLVTPKSFAQTVDLADLQKLIEQQNSSEDSETSEEEANILNENMTGDRSCQAPGQKCAKGERQGICLEVSVSKKNQCKQEGIQCLKANECCSGTCQNAQVAGAGAVQKIGVCTAVLTCSTCIPEGDKVVSDIECCKGNYENESGICTDDNYLRNYLSGEFDYDENVDATLALKEIDKNNEYIIPLEVLDGDLSAKQCATQIKTLNKEQFESTENQMNAFEFLFSTNTHKDKWGFLDTATSLGQQHKEFRDGSEKKYQSKHEELKAKRQELLPENEADQKVKNDSAGIKTLQLMAEEQAAMAERDKAKAAGYSGMVSGFMGFVQKVKAKNWGDKKWIVKPVLYKNACDKWQKKDKDCVKLKKFGMVDPMVPQGVQSPADIPKAFKSYAENNMAHYGEERINAMIAAAVPVGMSYSKGSKNPATREPWGMMMMMQSMKLANFFADAAKQREAAADCLAKIAMERAKRTGQDPATVISQEKYDQKDPKKKDTNIDEFSKYLASNDYDGEVDQDVTQSQTCQVGENCKPPASGSKIDFSGFVTNPSLSSSLDNNPELKDLLSSGLNGTKANALGAINKQQALAKDFLAKHQKHLEDKLGKDKINQDKNRGKELVIGVQKERRSKNISSGNNNSGLASSTPTIFTKEEAEEKTELPAFEAGLINGGIGNNATNTGEAAPLLELYDDSEEDKKSQEASLADQENAALSVDDVQNARRMASEFQREQGDSLFEIVTKAYVRGAYPHLLVPIAKVKKVESAAKEMIHSE